MAVRFIPAAQRAAERDWAVPGYSDSPQGEIAPSEASEPICRQPQGDVLVLRLNDRWQIAHDNLLQWIVQRVSKAGANPRGHYFLTRRHSLLRRIRESCGDVDPVAVAIIEGWPEYYRDWLRPLLTLRRD